MTPKLHSDWKPQISANTVAHETKDFLELRVASNGTVYWTETNPKKRGLTRLMSFDGQSVQATPVEGVRSLVNEYGGGSIAISSDGLYCVCSDQGIYSWDRMDSPEMFFSNAKWRFGDLSPLPSKKGILAVAEKPGSSQCIAAICSDGMAILQQGDDLYSSPTLSPDGKRIAWIATNRPDMPWECTTLSVAHWNETSLQADTVLGAKTHEAIQQPKWSADGWLYFLSDRTGYSNLYRWKDGSEECVVSEDGDIGYPAWILGSSAYALIEGEWIVYVVTKNAIDSLVLFNLHTKEKTALPVPFTSMRNLCSSSNFLYCVGVAPMMPPSVVRIHVIDKTWSVIRSAYTLPPEMKDFSRAEQIIYETPEGEGYAFFYPPCNSLYREPLEALPSLIVRAHGGPTLHMSNALNIEVQFWTSQGFAILEVNYSGSSGYGRAYRDRLNGQWGVADVRDCIAATQEIIKRKKADPERVFIRGSSAGGYTALNAAASSSLFKGAVCYYGIADLEDLVRHEHTFEKAYVQKLAGSEKNLHDRSPIHYAEKIQCPILFFHGEKDPVVSVEQSIILAKKIGSKAILKTFPEERHSFRNPETKRICLEMERDFYRSF